LEIPNPSLTGHVHKSIYSLKYASLLHAKNIKVLLSRNKANPVTGASFLMPTAAWKGLNNAKKVNTFVSCLKALANDYAQDGNDSHPPASPGWYCCFTGKGSFSPRV
jgi:hypothetical protein